MVSKAWNQIKSLDLIHIMHFGPLTDLYGTPGAPKKGSFGPQKAFFGPPEPDLVPTAADWSNAIGHMVTTHFGLVSALFWAPWGPKRAIFGPFGGLRGPRRAPEDQIWSQLPPAPPPGLHSWLPHTLAWSRPSSGPPWAPKGPVLAQNVPFWGQIRVRNIFCRNTAMWGV